MSIFRAFPKKVKVEDANTLDVPEILAQVFPDHTLQSIFLPRQD